MKKNASRCLAAVLACLLGIDTAAACRWIRSCGAAPAPVCHVPAWGGCCEPMPVCCPPVACCPPVESCGDCGSVTSVTTWSDCDCGTTTVIGESAPMTAPTSPTVHDAQEEGPTPTVADPWTDDEPTPTAAFGNGFRSDSPDTTTEAPSEAWDAGLDDANSEDDFVQESFAEPNQVEPAAAAEPEPMPEPNDADDLFGGGFDDEPQPADERPADDLFGSEPAESEPEPAFDDGPMDSDDLFGDPAAPADEPSFDDQPAAGDDLFGEPAEEAPMEEGDDLFGDEPMAEEPAEDEPRDDLFGDAPEPVEEAPSEEGADDLFGGFGDDEPFGDDADTAPAEDDLFGDEPEAPVEEMEPAAEEPETDDLFGGFGDEDEGGDDLFDADPQEEAPSDDKAIEDDLFDFGSILREPGGVHSAADRTWVDNSGRFSTVGRLIAVDGGVVRLAKPSGSVATVPLGRLSQADLEFVSRQAMAQIDARDWAIAHGVQPEADAPKQAKTDKERVAPLRTAQL